jgi:hypothetical protein
MAATYTEEQVLDAWYAHCMNGHASEYKDIRATVWGEEFSLWGGCYGDGDDEKWYTGGKLEGEARAAFVDAVFTPAWNRYQHGAAVLAHARIVASDNRSTISINLLAEELEARYELLSECVAMTAGHIATHQAVRAVALAAR